MHVTTIPLPTVRFAFLRDAATIYGGCPEYATSGSIGIDLRACFDPATPETVHLPAGGRLAIPSGLAIEPIPNPDGSVVCGFVYSRSGLGAVRGLTVAQGVGVIDPDYRGEITVVLLNTSHESHEVRRGDRIAQLVFHPVCRVSLTGAAELGTTSRGAGGFGHTGR